METRQPDDQRKSRSKKRDISNRQIVVLPCFGSSAILWIEALCKSPWAVEIQRAVIRVN